MNRSVVAAIALLAGAVIASPMLASAADQEAQMAQAGPDQPRGFGGPGGGPGGGMPGMGMGMRGRMGGGMQGDDGGGMGQRAGWMHRMMQMSPKERCEDRLARRAGIVAYVVAKLNLTDQQKPLWDKVQQAMQTAADKQRQLCANLKPRSERGQETLLDRMNQREQFLSAQLQGLQQVKPAAEQLYQALTPDQKAIVDHPFRHH